MLETAHSLIIKVAKQLGLGEADVAALLKVDAKHEFLIELSRGQKYPAYRVQHNNSLGPYKGGIRFHPEVNLEEVQALATLMSLKTAAVGLPLGGGKGGVEVDPRSLSDTELEELSRKYSNYLTKHIGPDKDVPGPDVGTNSIILDWMVDEYEKQTGDKTKASFTGKSLDNGGSLGRDSATGRGGVVVLHELLRLMDKKEPISYAVQGFGNVGSFFGLIAEQQEANWHLIAATDSSGGVTGKLSPKELDEHKKTGKRLADFDNQTISNEDLVTTEVDVLVLAALGDVITEKNMKDIKAKIILELANGPVNEEAYNYLSDQGVLIVPDVLANAGGVIVSYLEWLQNRAGEQWKEAMVNKKLHAMLVSATEDIYNYSVSQKVTLKESAFAIAMQRILRANKENTHAKD